jgi:uncharacterized protein (DUF58 family)
MTPRVTGSAKLLRKLEWRLDRAVENHLIGDYLSIYRGRGMEFDQVVKYEFGDDVRDIDWNVTARMGTAFRKRFIEERELQVLLVVEDSLSLQFGSGAHTKREAVFELAGLLMLLASINRDRVGLVYSRPGGHEYLAPVSGKNKIFEAATELFDRPLPSLEDKRPLGTPWRFLANAAPVNSIVVFLGDFAPRTPPREWPTVMQRYQAIGFRVDDPWERQLPDGKPLTAYDPTTQRVVVFDPRSSVHQQAHAAWVAEREAAFTHFFPRKKNRMAVTPDESMTDAVVRFFHAHMGSPR